MICVIAGATGSSCQRDVPPASASSQCPIATDTTTPPASTVPAGNPLESRVATVPLNYLFM